MDWRSPLLLAGSRRMESLAWELDHGNRSKVLEIKAQTDRIAVSHSKPRAMRCSGGKLKPGRLQRVEPGAGPCCVEKHRERSVPVRRIRFLNVEAEAVRSQLGLCSKVRDTKPCLVLPWRVPGQNSHSSQGIGRDLWGHGDSCFLSKTGCAIQRPPGSQPPSHPILSSNPDSDLKIWILP